MGQNRCPLCGGRILHGECTDCGYRLPDEDKLSAPYNLDPEDDRPEAFEPSHEKYKMPEAKPFTAQEYGGNAAPVKDRAVPNIKVAPTQNPFNNPYSPNGQQNNQPAGQNNQQGWKNPYNYNPAQQKNGNPVNPTPSQKPKSAVITVLVALLVMTFISPFFGVIGLCLNGSLVKELGEKKGKLFTVLFIIAIVLSYMK